MNTAVVLFTYNRPLHTKKVLEALSQNDVQPQKLIIFQDGVKPTTNESDWKNVGEIIRSVDWCDTEVHISPVNKGLAESIVQGVNYAFEANDAVIVLEDDCVAHPKFMDYMYESLDKYQSEKRVYGVGGFPGINLDKEGSADAYFVQRISSYGWGTWKDRWVKYKMDYSILKRIKENKAACERLYIWGNDLESHLLGNVTGECDSWAVFWALTVIEQDGLFLTPYESLITNIGFDGSGVHSGRERLGIKCRADDNIESLLLPDMLDITDIARQGYMDKLCLTSSSERNAGYRELLCKWVSLKQQGKEILFPYEGRKIAVWGKGWLFDLMQSEFGEQMQVQCIVETYPVYEEYKGIPVCMVDEMPKEIDMVIVIPFCDIGIIRRKIQKARPDIREITGVDEIIRERGKCYVYK